MKILVLSDHYPPHAVGGYELNCHALMQGLAGRGHDIRVLTTSYGLDRPRDDGPVHRRMEMLHSPQMGVRKRLAQIDNARIARKNARLALELAASFSPDLVYVAHMQQASLLPMFMLQEHGHTLVWRLESYWLIDLRDILEIESGPASRFYRSALLSFRRFKDLDLSRVVSIGRSLLEDHRQAHFDVSNWTVLPSPIDDFWFTRDAPTPLPAPGEPYRLLFAGRFTEIKGVDVAIRAVGLLKAHGLNLTLDCVGHGDPGYTAALQALVDELGLGETVRFRPFIPRPELPGLYDAHHLVLFPTRRLEGLGMVMVEALSRGVPVVASDIGGPRDVVDPGVTGLLVPPEDPQAMAAAVESLLTAPARLTAMANAAMQAIKKNYAMDGLLRRYETILIDATRRQGPHA